MNWLLDVNVLVALQITAHASNSLAVEWFARETQKGGVFIVTRITQMGFLRVTTNAKIFKENALSREDGWRRYDQLFENPGMEFWVEPDDLVAKWRALPAVPGYKGVIDTDFYIAAFAMCIEATVVTFDRGFSRIPGVSCHVLGAEKEEMRAD